MQILIFFPSNHRHEDEEADEKKRQTAVSQVLSTSIITIPCRHQTLIADMTGHQMFQITDWHFSFIPNDPPNARLSA